MRTKRPGPARQDSRSVSPAALRMRKLRERKAAERARAAAAAEAAAAGDVATLGVGPFGAKDRCATCGKFRSDDAWSWEYFGDCCALDALALDPAADAWGFGLAHGHAALELAAAKAEGERREGER